MASYRMNQVEARIEKHNRTQLELIRQIQDFPRGHNFFSNNFARRLENLKNEDLHGLKDDLADAQTVFQIADNIIKEEEQKQRLREELDIKLAQKMKKDQSKEKRNRLRKEMRAADPFL